VAVLDRIGYHQMRIKDVTSEAGVAAGLFHHYYSDLKTLVEEILDEYIAAFEATETIERDVSKGDWFNRLRSHYEISVRCHADHPGIMRCISQFCADDPNLRQRWQESYNQRLQLLADVLPYIFPDSSLNASEAHIIVRALSGIGQDILREYYIERNSALDTLELTETELAEWLAALFYRGLFARNPPSIQLHHAGKILSLQR
ncbi:MAG TPA: TetR/AcrR family transcriptional regulator, partial [Kineobactrum sp.]